MRAEDFATAVTAWYAEAGRDLPWRAPTTTPWGVLVSEVMLQQTPVARVVPSYLAWMTRWPAPSAMAEASPGEAIRQWGRLGYPRRALRLHEAAVTITTQHSGQVPSSHGALMALPGVGPYTAAAVATFAFGERHPVIDTNVRRVLARFADGRAASGSSLTARETRAAESWVPADPARASRYAVAVMELGALVCTARAPRCDACPVRAGCAWWAAGRPSAAAPRPAAPRPGYRGTDRQARGRLLEVLRDAPGAVPAGQLAAGWPITAQRERALAGLLADGLAVRTRRGYALPGG
ncbi:MAG TPA: A/G-specific adenine glycosylase [Mycobacteriales bacterium]|nr:A/G-specific adenine glycosylase [Mycobacteriales bacterium]